MILLDLIYYFHIALGCDTPILESLWISGDRKLNESQLLRNAIAQPLTEWGYTQNKSNDAFSILVNFGRKLDQLQTGLGFDVGVYGYISRFTVLIDYPRNSYHRVDGWSNEKTLFNTREDWIFALIDIFDLDYYAPGCMHPEGKELTHYAKQRKMEHKNGDISAIKLQ